jgi:uncharacterized small protein (DUF1192 family)
MPEAPPPDPLWLPVPEIEARVAAIRTLHERLKPRVARAELGKSRIRRP